MDEILKEQSNIDRGVDEWVARIKQGVAAELIVHPKGTSMLPLIRGGKDSVIVLPLDRPLKKGDVILFRRHDGKNVMHRVLKLDGEMVTTFGDGSVRPDDPIKKEAVLGLAVMLLKDGKTKKLDTALSRLYGRIHQRLFPVRRIAGSFKRKIKSFL